jgi:hypothetical protein
MFPFMGRHAWQAPDSGVDAHHLSTVSNHEYIDLPWFLTILLAPGNSCLVANVIDTLRDDKSLRNDCVIYHFVGASASSSNARLVLIRLCSLLLRQFDLNFVLPDDFPSLVRCFRLLIKYVVKVDLQPPASLNHTLNPLPFFRAIDALSAHQISGQTGVAFHPRFYHKLPDQRHTSQV